MGITQAEAFQETAPGNKAHVSSCCEVIQMTFVELMPICAGRELKLQIKIFKIMPFHVCDSFSIYSNCFGTLQILFGFFLLVFFFVVGFSLVFFFVCVVVVCCFVLFCFQSLKMMWDCDYFSV